MQRTDHDFEITRDLLSRKSESKVHGAEVSLTFEAKVSRRRLTRTARLSARLRPKRSKIFDIAVAANVSLSWLSKCQCSRGWLAVLPILFGSC